MIKDTFYSLVPINWLLRSAALSNVYRKGTQLAESGSILKNIFLVISLGILNMFCLYHKMSTFRGNRQTSLIKFCDAIQVTYWLPYFEYIIDLYFVYKHGRGSLLKYFKTYDDKIDAMLGIPCYSKIRRTMVNVSVFSITIFAINSLTDYLSWMVVGGWKAPTVYSIDYLYFYFNMLTVFDIISHVIQVEYRLKMIRNILLADVFCIGDENLRMNNNMEIGIVSTLTTIRHRDATWFHKCYLLLQEQVDYVNASYGLRVMVYCINLLINMISLFNLAIRIMIDSLYQGAKDFRKVSLHYIILSPIFSIMRALNYEIMILLLIYRCEQTYKESDIILKTIDDLLAGQNNYDKAKMNLMDMRNLLITRPIKFHAAKFFSIDYTLFVSLNSVVVTYTIIMLQSIQ